MENTKTFDIILTVWNRLGHTKRTIASLIGSGAVSDCERFIIVDNRSTEEGMEDFLRDMYHNIPDVSHKVWLVRRPKNDGWGAAVNDALGLSRARYLLLVNNDVEFENDAHKKAIEMLRQHNETDTIRRPIGILALWHHIHHAFTGVVEGSFREMDNVPAVAWVMDKLLMEKVGLLPEHGPCLTKGGNGEDVAYVNRMRDAGYMVGVPTEDIAHHIDGY